MRRSERHFACATASSAGSGARCGVSAGNVAHFHFNLAPHGPGGTLSGYPGLIDPEAEPIPEAELRRRDRPRDRSQCPRHGVIVGQGACPIASRHDKGSQP